MKPDGEGKCIALIRSMTGYGRHEAVLHGRRITVEVRAVNNRFLDCSIKIPRSFVFAEERLKAMVQEHIHRGKVDVFVSLETVEESAAQPSVRVNHALLGSYMEACAEIGARYQVEGSVSYGDLLRLPDVFSVEKAEVDPEALLEDISAVLEQALGDFDTMRRREGVKLAEDLLGRGDKIATLLSTVESHGDAVMMEYRERLSRRMQEVLEHQNIDESRILAEAAIYADKSAVDEETVRLRSHISQLREIISVGGSIGRKLDFLMQEFNREANTISSKCSHLETGRVMLEMKGEIEKMREQVQNIE